MIDEALFDRLHHAAGIPARFPIGNAGVIHVYGYWFSTAVTPYGYKRDRWNDGELATLLGQDHDAFHLAGDEESTPLRRVTEAVLPLLESPPASARGSADLDLDGLKARVVLIGEDASSAALIYGLDSGEGWRMITTFPLSGATNAVLNEFTTDRRLRWNAVDPRGC